MEIACPLAGGRANETPVVFVMAPLAQVHTHRYCGPPLHGLLSHKLSSKRLAFIHWILFGKLKIEKEFVLKNVAVHCTVHSAGFCL